MIETTGAVPIVEPARALGLLVLVPLAWALGCAAFRRHAPRIATLGAAITSALAVRTLVLAVSAALRGRAGVMEHVATAARLGSLDLRVDLVADARAGLVCLVASALGLTIVLSEVASGGAPSARRLGWTGALVAGIAVASLGDGFAPVLAGAQLVTLATFALGGDARVRSLLVATAGDGALVLAMSVLFWGLGGTFGAAGYVNDGGPRAALVATGTVQDGDPKRATLVVPSYGGARVTSDRDVPLPGEPLVAPFAVDLEAGVVSFRVTLGPAAPDVLATNVTLAPGRTHVLVPLGPTASFREIAERSRVVATEVSPEALAGRLVAGLPLRTVLALLFAFGLFARLALLVTARGPSPALALASLFAVDAGVRFAAVVGPASIVLVVLGVLVAALLGAHAARRARAEPGQGTAQGPVLAGLAALGVALAGLGVPGAAIGLALATALGGAAVSAASARSAPRWSAAGGAVIVALFPYAGVSSSLVSGLCALLEETARGRVPGAIAVSVILGTIAAVSLLAAALRGATEGEHARGATHPRLAPPFAAAAVVLAVAVGPLLGVGASVVPGTAPSLADRLLHVSAAWPAARSLASSPRPLVAFASVVLVTGAGVVGWLAARRIASAPLLARAEAVGLAWTSSSGDALGGAVRTLVRGVVVVDREVLEDFGAAVAAGVGRVARRIAPGAPRPSLLDRGAEMALARVGLDDPRGLARIRDVALALAVALPVLLVLSSWVFG